MSIEELEELLANAYAIRTRAYKQRAPRFFIQSINQDIRTLSDQLHEAKK